MAGFLLDFFVRRVGLMEAALVAAALASAAAFFAFFADKRRAKAGGRRLRERTLLAAAVLAPVGSILAMLAFRHKLRKPRFRRAAAAGALLFLVAALHIGHGMTLGRMVRFLELEFRSESWPEQLDGYRIAFMSDFHTIPHDGMARVVAGLNARGMDLALLGGDFSMGGGHFLGTLAELARLEAADGIFGVEGNHDEHGQLFAEMERLGIAPLDNGGLYVREGFFLAGVADMWNREPDIAAVSGAGGGSFVLLLSHNPDFGASLPAGAAGLVLSGHTHGGQINFFGYPLYLRRGTITSHGTAFARGFASHGGSPPVFVTSGVGVYYRVPRIFSRPEAVIFTMRSGG